MTRVQSLDVLKLIAAFGVVGIHTLPLGVPVGVFSFDAAACLNALTRLSVPLFFISGGYFSVFITDEKLKRQCLSLVLVCFSWSVIYFSIRFLLTKPYPAFHFVSNHAMNEVIDFSYKLFFFGFERHLWFIPAYILAAILLNALLKRLPSNKIILLACVLYLLGLIGQGWGKVLGFDYFDSHLYLTRNGIFWGLPCFIVGRAIRWASLNNISIAGLAVVTTLLFCAHFFEINFFLSSYAYMPDYTFASGLTTACIFMLFLKLPDKIRIENSFTLSKMANGVYLVHGVFLYLIPLLVQVSSSIKYTSLVFASSLIFTYVGSRIKPLRRLLLIG